MTNNRSQLVCLPLRALLSIGVAAALCVTQPVLTQSRFTVADIRIEGLQRVAASNVFGLLNVRVGEQVDQSDIANIIRDIYASEYFDNIEVLVENNVLIIKVSERPTVSELNIEGNKLIKTEQLMENMEKAGLAVGQIYQPTILEAMQLALEEQYVAQGMYGASVDLDVKEQDRNRVQLDINVTEGEAAKIVHINIEGNSVFDEEALQELFELKESHFMSFIRKDDRYAKEKINGDLERLTSFYMDRGYINFEVISTQVTISPAKDQVYITVNINEGELYTVNQVELAGDLVDSEEILRILLQVRTGQTFSQQLVTSTSEYMKQLLGNRGYFFAEVEGVPKINEEDKTVDVTFFVEPGKRTYVNRISFRGNTNTADEVLRREMRQMEGAPASNALLEQSKIRMQRLGYFSEVEFVTTPTPGTEDQVDVEYTVEEQLSGSVGGSIGYGQLQGLVLSANLQQANFLGTGKSVGVNVNTSTYSTNYSFNYFDPYYTIDGVSRGFTLGYSTSDWAKLNLASYSTNQFTATTSYGYQLGETQQLSFNLGYNHTSIDEGYGPVQEIKSSPSLIDGVDYYIKVPGRSQSFIDQDTGEIYPILEPVIAPISELPQTAFNQYKGFIDRDGTVFDNFTLSLAWSQSTLNLGLFPTAGGAQNLSFEFSLPGSDLSYYRLRYFKEQYFPLTRNWIIHGRLDLGYGDGYGSTEQLPFFQNFYAGGQGTVRGFRRLTLGPRATFPANYVTSNVGYLRDANGNIAVGPDGNPVLDLDSPVAYQLAQAIDEQGNPLFDENQLPVLQQELARQNLYNGRAVPFGGNVQTTATLELLFPLPFLKDRNRTRSAFFVDAGNVFSTYCADVQQEANNCFRPSFGGLRYSAGVAVSWMSGAFGVMTFSYSKPFNASPSDEIEMFQFNIGNTF
jgi:outer membrane protein insertion porin family